MSLKIITSFIQKPLVPLLLATVGSTGLTSAGLTTLTSPDGSWSLSSDEFGAFGESVAGSFAQRDFGSGLTGYAWTAGVLITDGTSSQWLAGDANFGMNGLTAIAASNVISDVTSGNTRTSTFNVPNFSDLRVTLTQAATNDGISQQYSITNLGGSSTDLRMISFQDVDLDGSTFTDNIISVSGSTLGVSQGTRTVGFTPDSNGYLGYLAGHVPGGGVTGNLDILAFSNSGIPAANLNQFVGFSGSGVIDSDFDTNLDMISDSAADVGYLFQNNFTIGAGETVDLTFLQGAAIPEPGSMAMLSLFGLATLLRRRR